MGGSRIRRINFVEFNARINTLGSIVPVFPKYGSLLLATLMRDKGYEVRYFLEGVSELDYDAMADADALCLTVFAPALTKVRAFASRVRREKPGLPVILGGPQVCYFPETVLDCCTAAVRCEGDEVLPLIVERLAAGREIAGVPGISFLEGGRAVHVPEGPPPAIPATIPDVTLIEGFERVSPGVPGLHAVVNTLQTTRGCRFRCKFCPVHRLFQGVYRSRDIESVVADVKARLKHSKAFFVVDNDFCSDRKGTKALLERLIEENTGAMFTVFERHEIGRDPEMLELLRNAGVRVLIVGVESLLDKSLKAFNKGQTQGEVLKSIRNITDAGMSVLSTFVVGYDEDTPESAAQLMGFVRENRLILNLFILHDAEEDESKGLLIPLNRRFMTYYRSTAPWSYDFWDYMTGSFVTYFPRRMKPSTLQKLLFHINEQNYSHMNILRDMFSWDLFRSFFGIAVGYGMKGINRNLSRFTEKAYMEYLERIEEGLYDEREELIEEKLASIRDLPLPPPVAGFVNTPLFRVQTALAILPSLVRLGVLTLARMTGLVAGPAPVNAVAPPGQGDCQR